MLARKGVAEGVEGTADRIAKYFTLVTPVAFLLPPKSFDAMDRQKDLRAKPGYTQRLLKGSGSHEAWLGICNKQI